MWRRYGKYNSDKLEKISLILEKCTVEDRYAILEIAATVFLKDDYDEGDVSDKICRAILDNKEPFVVNGSKLPFHAALPLRMRQNWKECDINLNYMRVTTVVLEY